MKKALLLGILLLVGPILLSAQGQLQVNQGSLSYKNLHEYRFDNVKKYNLSDLFTLKEAKPPHRAVIVAPPGNRYFDKAYNRGLLITYQSYEARSVAIAGDYNNWQKNPLHQNKYGLWYILVPATAFDRRITYKLNIDGVWVQNPLGQSSYQERYGYSGKVSTAAGRFRKKNKQAHARVLPSGKVRFAIYLPDAKRVTVAGSFNGWNIWHDFLTKGEDGVWHLTKHLPPGKYLYRFYVDNQWQLDQYNSRTRRDRHGKLASVIVVPSEAS